MTRAMRRLFTMAGLGGDEIDGTLAMFGDCLGSGMINLFKDSLASGFEGSKVNAYRNSLIASSFFPIPT